MNKQVELMLIRSELIKIGKWFIDNDWVVNKIVTGEWEKTDKRWVKYLNDRITYRNKQDALNLRIEELKIKT